MIAGRSSNTKVKKEKGFCLPFSFLLPPVSGGLLDSCHKYLLYKL